MARRDPNISADQTPLVLAGTSQDLRVQALTLEQLQLQAVALLAVEPKANTPPSTARVASLQALQAAPARSGKASALSLLAATQRPAASAVVSPFARKPAKKSTP
ncbi:MAG: hypothetical protein NTZ90_05150 [Proteobacteria bacterium]|nr:hypothetical protein [Pseudomonadota bacterium]